MFPNLAKTKNLGSIRRQWGPTSSPSHSLSLQTVQTHGAPEVKKHKSEEEEELGMEFNKSYYHHHLFILNSCLWNSLSESRCVHEMLSKKG
ncbi:hypothetical protein CEXT_397081 [Caerostris extrusa]|uniref:Uncharacterized protein n=1 Tax=Caerostris extrusa TaxID=172846 RepID=A0AAV4PED0_CAEEX|nr:hypothetical protein CEXT_397081 [Caerostris extrusa]